MLGEEDPQQGVRFWTSRRFRVVLLGLFLSGSFLAAGVFFGVLFVQVDMTVSVPPDLLPRPTHLMIMVTDSKRSDIRFLFPRLQGSRCRLIFFRHRPRTYHLILPAFATQWPGESRIALMAGREYELEQDGETTFTIPLLQPFTTLSLKRSPLNPPTPREQRVFPDVMLPVP